MRLAEFDREQVLRSAMNQFMSKGFNKTSMQDLKKATGLHPGSIYCAFENKRGLLLAALEHYANERTVEFDTIFASQPTVMQGLTRYFCMIVDECAREEIKDCLMQKALSEWSQQDEEVEQIIRDTLNFWKLGLLTQLRRAQQQGEISAQANCEFLAEFLVMGIYGLRAYAHTKPGKALLCKMAEQLLSTLQA